MSRLDRIEHDTQPDLAIEAAIATFDLECTDYLTKTPMSIARFLDSRAYEVARKKLETVMCQNRIEDTVQWFIARNMKLFVFVGRNV